MSQVDNYKLFAFLTFAQDIVLSRSLFIWNWNLNQIRSRSFNLLDESWKISCEDSEKSFVIGLCIVKLVQEGYTLQVDGKVTVLMEIALPS